MKKAIMVLSAIACIATIPVIPLCAKAEENSLVTVDGLTYEFMKLGDDNYECFLADVVDKNSTTITIPAEVNGAPVINCNIRIFDNCVKLTEINVDEDNQYLQSIDGVLFYKPNQDIICYPAAKEGEDYIVPEGTSFINTYGGPPFRNCKNLRTVTMPENTNISHSFFWGCPNLTHVYNATVSDTGTLFAQFCPNLKEISFKGAQERLYFVEGILCPESIVFQDDVSFRTIFGLYESQTVKEIHVPKSMQTSVLEWESKRNDTSYKPVPDFESYVVQRHTGDVKIENNEALEVVYLRYDSMHSGVKISNCPNLREIIIEDKDEILKNALRQYSEFYTIEYDSYLDLSNLPSLESVTCHRPETNMYIRAEDCGAFTVYGSQNNTKLQEVCHTKDIPYAFMDNGEAYAAGDVDGNGTVNIMDVILLNRNLMIGADITAQGMTAADVTKDGTVDAVDSLKILRYIVGLDELTEV